MPLGFLFQKDFCELLQYLDTCVFSLESTLKIGWAGYCAPISVMQGGGDHAMGWGLLSEKEILSQNLLGQVLTSKDPTGDGDVLSKTNSASSQTEKEKNKILFCDMYYTL